MTYFYFDWAFTRIICVNGNIVTESLQTRRICLMLPAVWPRTHTHTHAQSQTPFTNQQTVGGVDGEAAGEGVVNGKSVHIGGLQVAAPPVNVAAHVEVERVASRLALLAHVPQLHVGQMHRCEVLQNLSVEDGRATRV